MKKNFESIDEYIASFPKNVQTVLEQIRQAIKDAAPKAEEAIGYNMPAFKLNGNLVWFGAFKNHIGFYPRESAIEEFKEKLSGYKRPKKIYFLKDLPKNLYGKVMRKDLKKKFEGR